MARRAAGHTGSRKKEGFTDAGYVLFSVPADGRRHGLRADGRMRKAAAHGAAAGCAHLRADPSGAGRAGGVTPHGGERPSADRRAVYHAHERQLRRPPPSTPSRSAPRRSAAPSEGRTRRTSALWKGETDIVSLRSTLLFGLKGMAAYAPPRSAGSASGTRASRRGFIRACAPWRRSTRWRSGSRLSWSSAA